MTVIGIDLGKSGAIAFMNDAGDVVLRPMPIISGDRDEYDVPAIAAMLSGVGDEHAFLEKLQPLPPKMGGSIASYSRGLSLGLFVGILTCKRIPFTLVSPQRWQKVMLAGTPGTDTKQRSILAAQRLFPLVDLRRTPACKKPHDGLADAVLIAEFGRRNLK